GIIELAKNSYDADAIQCVIELANVGEPGGLIRIEDDGEGMTLQQIRDGFLVLGRSGKDAGERTGLGRVPSGSKGLGRLAALRLGGSVELSTRPRGEGRKTYGLHIDWSDYERQDLIDDVRLEIRSRPRAKGERHGTTLTLEGLRHKLTRPDVKRLARALILLADPFDSDPSGFRPQLRSPEFEDLEQLVSARYFED